MLDLIVVALAFFAYGYKLGAWNQRTAPSRKAARKVRQRIQKLRSDPNLVGAELMTEEEFLAVLTREREDSGGETEVGS